MPRSRPRRITLALLRGLVYVTAAILVLVLLAVAAIQTGWGKNQIRRLIVHEANQYLTATLTIGRLEGSLLRDLTLGDIRLTRDGETVVSADEIAIGFSIRELVESGTTIRSIQLTRPRVVAARLPDGRWNLAALLKRTGREDERTGPGRPLHLLAINVVDGDVLFRNPLLDGDVHVPSHFAKLNASLSFDYEPVTWQVNLASVAWAGDEANLAMNRLTGRMSDGPDGWQFDTLAVQTPQSAFTLTGRINPNTTPATLDLHVVAKRFLFQEWASVVDALGHIDIDSAFDLTLKGPPAALATDLRLRSTDGTNGGDIQTQFILNTTVDGWHGAGTASVARVNLARWLDEVDRPSDITGRLTFDLDFVPPDHHFPRGAFTFDGPHAAYLGYEMENLRARGTLTRTDAVIANATGAAYGSVLHVTSGTIGIDAPNAYHFVGTDSNLDLRKLPASVPVTHVESLMALDAFDVAGQFEVLSLTGHAQFGDSTYLGAAIAAGAVGAIDTSVTPVRYSGDATVSGLDIHRFGEGLATEWMLDPRWAGVVAGHFHMEGTGSDSATRTLDGGGRLASANISGGRLFDADIDLHIADGSLSGSYDGQLAGIDAARAFADPRFDATLTGIARAHFAVRDLLLRAATLSDYDVDGTLDATKSVVRGLAIDAGSLTGKLAGSTLDVTSAQMSGPQIDARGSGALELDGERSSRFDYSVARADVSLGNTATGRRLAGTMETTGQLTGPTSVLHLVGDASVTDFRDLDVDGADIAAATMQYDATVPLDDLARTTARVTAHASMIDVLNRQIPEADATIAYNGPRLDVDLMVGSDERLTGSVLLHPGGGALDLSALAVTVGTINPVTVRLADAATPPTIAWTDRGVDTMPLVFERANGGADRLTMSGTWRADGSGALHIAGSHVLLDTLLGASDRPAEYGGVADFDATLSGTLDQPTATGEIAITEGRVRKLTYQRLGGHVEYGNGLAKVNLRLDQTSDTWLTAVGSVPLNLVGVGQPDQAMDLTVASSAVSLGLLEGLTDVVRNVSGTGTVNVKVTGTSQDPHFTGSMAFADTAFVVASTGARYKNGRASFELVKDQVNVASFHLEDRNGRALSVTGSMGTHALTVGDLKIDIVASRFEVLHDETGSVDVDARLALRGEVNAPRLAGDVTVLSGELKIDEIFSQALYQPYSTISTAPPAALVDTIAALNPWDALSLAVTVHSRGTLRLTGDNVQVAQGTPLGLGSFNLHATGDLYLSKDRGQPLDVSGSFDSVTGSFAFQGRRFEIDPTSSINFHGDLDPGLYVTVSRVISGVEARVTISGTVHAPELRLASTPPLESSDILSLIVFNASTNELTGPQQQELAVRAGTLAYGFVATPLISALQRSIGLDTLEIALPGAANTGPRVTVGNELVPGLVAQFTRQFGEAAYDEATVEYYISRIFRIRATFSDAGSLVSRPFQRTERAGIDLLLFFSF